MNKHVLTFCIFSVCSACFSTLAQGLVAFQNEAPGLNAKVTDTDGMTGLAGSAWEADLYWAAGTVTDSRLLVALNQPTTFSTVQIEAGYFFGGVRTIPTNPYFPVTLQVRVWDSASGSSWAAAAATPGARAGESILFQVTLGDPTTIPPGNATIMHGLDGHPWSVSIVGVPEPSTLALAGLGLTGILVLHRSRFCGSIHQHSPGTTRLTKGFRRQRSG
jgi:hypothetical protein